jgi:hypothetical protein
MMKTKLFLSAASLLVSLGASSGAIGGALAAPVADPVVADPVVYREASASSTPDKFVALWRRLSTPRRSITT